MANPNSSNPHANEATQEENDEPIKRIRKELKDWERSFHKSNGRPPQKEDIRASPSIHVLYKEYASLKTQQSTQFHIQRNEITRTSLHDNDTCVQVKVEPREHQDYNQLLNSEASDDSHISATPSRKPCDISSGLSSNKIKKGPLDVIAKTLPKILKNKGEDGRLENDSVFLAEKNNLCILRKGSKKVSLRNQEKYCKKPVEPKIKALDSVHNGNTLLFPNISELGFSIKVQRPGERAEQGTSNDNDAEIVPPGFFSSSTPSSLVKSGWGISRKISSNQDSQHEPLWNGTFSEDDASRNIHKTVLTEVFGNNCSELCKNNKNGSMQLDKSKKKKNALFDSSNILSAEGFDDINAKGYRYHVFSCNDTKNTEQEKKFATSPSNTEQTPDLPIPQEDSKDNQNPFGSFSNKTISRSKKGKSKGKPLNTGNSWSNPKVLKKVAKKHQNMIIGPEADTVKNSNCLSKKISGGGNFVKLNLNGRGRRSHKFVNKGSKRKATSYGRTSHRRKRQRGDNKSEGNDCLHEANDAVIIEMDEHGNYQKELKTHSVQGRTGQSTGETGQSKEISEGYKSNQIQGQNYQSLLKETAENVLREQSEQNLLKLLKMTHGFDSFRSGQLETIKRVIAMQSTMLVLPTGSGKSLCYQLPALILPGVTLVISPLVALMVDQLQHLPTIIPGSLLTGGQTGKEVAETLDRLRTGAIKVLFISPERLLNDNFLSIIESIPLISLVVVDEAHCLSEWSHNFRPSYFRLGTVVRKRLKVRCVLAMTATATKKTLQSILHSLEISPRDVVQVSHMRENLQLSFSFSQNRMKDLLSLIKSPPFLEARSIIVYCKFQAETDSVSKFLRDNNIHAKSYHSGLPAKDRKQTQDMFCSNKLRVVVATVAFGMGFDKSDVEAVIHYSLPGSLEHYVQETGRAGRDGRLAYCHLFLDEMTYFKIRSLSYSDGADEYAVNKFLCELFVSYKDTPTHLHSLNIASASRIFDLKEEVMVTILSYLEIEEVQYLRVLPQLNATCSLCFHKSSPSLLAKKSMFIDALLKRIQSKHGHYIFDIPTFSNDTGMEVANMLKELEKLQFLGEITYELKDPAFCYIIYKVPENFCSLTTQIVSWLAEVEISKVQKLDAMYSAAMHAIKESKQYDSCRVSLGQSCLLRITDEYFNSENYIDASSPNRIQERCPFLRADIKVFLQSNTEMNFAPRAIARIMHGLSSPAYPATIWSKNHFWGRYSKIDFNIVKEAAASELMAFKGGSRILRPIT